MSKDESTERFEMRAAPSWLRAVDEWRRREDDLPSRAEAIRRLVLIALKAKRSRADAS